MAYFPLKMKMRVFFLRTINRRFVGQMIPKRLPYKHAPKKRVKGVNYNNNAFEQIKFSFSIQKKTIKKINKSNNNK